MGYGFNDTPSFSDDDLDGDLNPFASNAKPQSQPAETLPFWGGPLDGRCGLAAGHAVFTPKVTPDDGPIWLAFGANACGRYVREGQRLRWVAR